MRDTTHIQTRMNQRGIRKGLVELAVDLGYVEGDHYILDSKTIRSEILELRRRLRFLDDAEKKGGIVVVAAGEALVTTYRVNSFTRPGLGRSNNHCG